MELNERILEAAILNELARDKVPVTVTLVNDTEFQGIITRFDVLVIILLVDGVQKIIYKHSIASITPTRPLRSAQSKN